MDDKKKKSGSTGRKGRRYVCTNGRKMRIGVKGGGGRGKDGCMG